MNKHSHGAAHFVIGAAIVAGGGASTLAVAYTVAQSGLPSPVRELALVTSSVFAASLALTPLFLAPAYGDAIRKGRARGQLLLLTMMILLVDGAMQMNAIDTFAASLRPKPEVNHIVAFVAIAAFQLATFFLRGSLIEAHHERATEQAAQALALEQERTEQQKIADRKAARKAREKKKKAEARKAEVAANGGLSVVKGGRN